jgi:hypothetical protein
MRTEDARPVSCINIITLLPWISRCQVRHSRKFSRGRRQNYYNKPMRTTVRMKIHSVLRHMFYSLLFANSVPFVTLIFIYSSFRSSADRTNQQQRNFPLWSQVFYRSQMFSTIQKMSCHNIIIPLCFINLSENNLNKC